MPGKKKKNKWRTGTRSQKDRISDKGKSEKYDRSSSTPQIENRVTQKSPFNDMSWYDANPKLTQAAASVPYPYRPGMILPTGLNSLRIPGVLQINWVPTIGQSASATDPASIAAKEIYATVRNAFSGSLDADGPDYIMYFLALDSIFSYIGSLKRIFRIVNTYTPMNYNVPDCVFAALGVTETLGATLKRDRMQLFQVINELVGMTRKFRCPAIFPLFNRHYWLNDNVYTDAATPNSQMYAFNQTYFYKFALQNTPESVPAGGLSMVASPYSQTSTESVSDLFDFGRELIDALAGWEDAYTISGYLQRAYEGTSIFTVDEITLGEEFQPLYEESVLAQIENAFAVGQLGVSPWAFDVTTNVVSQDPRINAVLCAPQVSSSVDLSIVGKLNVTISIRNDEPSLSDTVEATRLHSYVQSDGKIGCGTEIVASMRVFPGPGSSNDMPLGSLFVYDSTMTVSQMSSSDNLMSMLSQFDWHPIVFKVYKASNTVFVGYMFGDLHNVTVISQEQMRQINRICLYSEFNSFNMA